MPCMIFHAIYSADLSLLPKLGILPFIILALSVIYLGVKGKLPSGRPDSVENMPEKVNSKKKR